MRIVLTNAGILKCCSSFRAADQSLAPIVPAVLPAEQRQQYQQHRQLHKGKHINIRRGNIQEQGIGLKSRPVSRNQKGNKQVITRMISEC